MQTVKSDYSRVLSKNSQISLHTKLGPFHERSQSNKDKEKSSSKLSNHEDAMEMPLIERSVISVKEPTDNKSGILYERNQSSDTFMLILSGKVDICSGKDVNL